MRLILRSCAYRHAKDAASLKACSA